MYSKTLFILGTIQNKYCQLLTVNTAKNAFEDSYKNWK